MTIGANSYGSVAEVAALTKRYTASGSYGTTTNPTTIQVEKFIDRVSAIVNVLLAEAGFAVPVSQADAKLVLDDFAVGQVVLLCHAANGSGIYAPGSESLRSTTPLRGMLREAEAFVGGHAQGFERLGATRTYGAVQGLSCLETNDAGTTIEPTFQRGMIGNAIVDWDTG